MEQIEVVVGRVGKPHGVRGEVTVEVRSDEPDRRFAAGAVLRGDRARGSTGGVGGLTVASTRWHQGRLLVVFEELTDRSAAEAARGTLLLARIDAGERPEDPEEFYAHQLVGLAAYDEDDRHLGEVAGLVHGGAQDLLAIRTREGQETLVPFVKELVPEVDLTAGRVVVADRPGLVAPSPDD